MAKRLIELIEQAGDMALSKHISLTSEVIANHLIRGGVEIPVYCKDCVYFKTEEWHNVCLHAEKGIVCPEPTDFCSYGEHKEKENNNGQETNRFGCIDPAGAANGKPRKPRRN